MGSSELFQRNMNYIKTRTSSISYEALLKAPEDSGKLSITDSGQGFPLFHGHSSAGEVLLHSKRNPEEEAARQLEQWEKNSPVDWNAVVLVFGFAGMHHVLKAYEKLDKGGTLIVIDCIPEVFKKALQFCDLSKFEKNIRNIIFIISDNPESASRELRHYLSLTPSVSTAIFTQPGLLRCFGDIYKSFYDRIIIEIRTEISDRVTRVNLNDEWIQNAVLNIPAILRAGSINRFKGIFKGKDALMIAAGPSLMHSIEYIKKKTDDYIIFSVGTALKPLLKAGIEPDFIVVADSDVFLMKQFSGLEMTGKSILLTSPIIFPDVPGMFPKEKLAFFSTSVPVNFNEFLSGIDFSLDGLAAGGTVSLTAIDAAVYCGCEKIIFCGLDLSFLDDGTTHAGGSMYDGQKSRKENLVKVKGNFGKEVFTSRPLSTYITLIDRYLENTLGNKKISFYNAASGGALLNNTTVISPAEILTLSNSDKAFDKKQVLSSALGKQEIVQDEKALAFLERTMTEILELKNTAEKALNAAEMLNKLNIKIREKTAASLLVSSAMQPLLANMSLSETPDSEAGRLFCKNLSGAADWIYGFMEMAYNSCKSKHALKIGIIK